jgi:hypothetical protein
MRRAGLAACTLAHLAACADESVLELGYIEYASSPFVIELPSPLLAGQPIIATITTYGNGCVSAYSTGQATSEDTIYLTPFDVRRLPDDGACPDIVQSMLHRVEIVFPLPGTWTVRVHGRAFADGTTTELERDAVVAVE